MELVFIDESGYTFNWIKDIERQPFYVLSALIVPVTKYTELIAQLKTNLTGAGYPHAHEVGRNFEIKAREIASGDGSWGSNEQLRNVVRDNFLDFAKGF